MDTITLISPERSLLVDSGIAEILYELYYSPWFDDVEASKLIISQDKYDFCISQGRFVVMQLRGGENFRGGFSMQLSEQDGQMFLGDIALSVEQSEVICQIIGSNS